MHDELSTLHLFAERHMPSGRRRSRDWFGTLEVDISADPAVLTSALEQTEAIVAEANGLVLPSAHGTRRTERTRGQANTPYHQGLESSVIGPTEPMAPKRSQVPILLPPFFRE